MSSQRSRIDLVEFDFSCEYRAENEDDDVSAPGNAAKTERLGFIDDARGLAVVLMIFWHTVDGYTRTALRAEHPELHSVLQLFGGTAAPMFVSLAGVSAAMKLHGDRTRGRDIWPSVRSLVARGLHVVAMGYALRVYNWVIDDRALFRLSAAGATIPTVLGIGAAAIGFERVSDRKPHGLALALGGIALYAFGIVQATAIEPARALSLLKVDVLQAIGMSIVVVALLDPLLKTSSRPLLALVVGFLIALPTEAIATRLPGSLPPPLAAYLGRWEGTNGSSLAGFPLFPWVGYAFVGAAIGNAWSRASDVAKADRIVFGVSATFAALAALTNSPAMHEHVFPAFQAAYKPFFMIHKVGFGLTLVALLHLFTRATGFAPLRELGKTSMLIYWVHLEFAYGICSRPVKRALDYGEWAIAFVVLTLAMMLLSRIRLRAPAYFSARSAARRSPPIGSC